MTCLQNVSKLLKTQKSFQCKQAFKDSSFATLVDQMTDMLKSLWQGSHWPLQMFSRSLLTYQVSQCGLSWSQGSWVHYLCVWKVSNFSHGQHCLLRRKTPHTSTKVFLFWPCLPASQPSIHSPDLKQNNPFCLQGGAKKQEWWTFVWKVA